MRDYEEYGFTTLARNTDPATSHIAAAMVGKGAEAQRAHIMEYLTNVGFEGATSDEIDRHFGWYAATASRRMHELVKNEQARETERTRLTSRGRPAIVYVATQAN